MFKSNLSNPNVAVGLGMIFFLSLAVIGCESKFSESSPDTVKIEGVSLEERISQKNKVDAKIDEIQNSVNKIRNVIEIFRKIKSPIPNRDVYTPIDFLVDLNNELKARIPENQKGKLARHTSFDIPVESLSEACRHVDVVLEESEIYDGVDAEKVAIGQSLTYSLKTCGSKDQYLEAIVADWIDSTLELKLISKNLEVIFNEILTKELKNSICKIKQDKRRIIDTVTCEDFYVRLSGSEKAYVNAMTFSSSGDILYETIFELYENKDSKGSFQLRVPRSGKPEEIQLDFEKPKVLETNGQ